MDVSDRIVATVVGGLLVAFIVYLVNEARKRFNLAAAIVRLKLSQSLPDPDVRLVLRHIRDGKDEVSDKGPLLNEDQPFRPGVLNHEWLTTTSCQKNIGFQFKCYIDYPAHLQTEVMAFLGICGFTGVSQDETLPNRLWFLLPKAPTCETVDHYTNNYFHSGVREILHEA